MACEAHLSEGPGLRKEGSKGVRGQGLFWGQRGRVRAWGCEGARRWGFRFGVWGSESLSSGS